MSAAVVTRAVALSTTIHETTHRRTLEGAVKEFVEVLASVPDYRPPELSVDGATGERATSAARSRVRHPTRARGARAVAPAFFSRLDEDSRAVPSSVVRL